MFHNPRDPNGNLLRAVSYIDAKNNPMLAQEVWIKFVRGANSYINFEGDDLKEIHDNRFFFVMAYDLLYAGGVYLCDDQGKSYQYNPSLYLITLPDGSNLQLQSNEFDIRVYSRAEIVSEYGLEKTHEVYKAAYDCLIKHDYINNFSQEIIQFPKEILIKKMEKYISTQGALYGSFKEFQIPREVSEHIGSFLNNNKERNELIYVCKAASNAAYSRLTIFNDQYITSRKEMGEQLAKEREARKIHIDLSPEQDQTDDQSSAERWKKFDQYKHHRFLKESMHAVKRKIYRKHTEMREENRRTKDKWNQKL